MWLKAYQELSRQDPIIKSLLKQVEPCPLKPRRGYFLILCDTIVSQQLSTKVANVIFNRFKNLYPSTIKPQDILKTPDKKLRSVGLSYQKISYLKDLSQKVNDNEVILRFSTRETNEQIIERLTQVKGIGRWSVEMFLIFSLARQDVFSVGDLGLRQALVNHGYLKDRKDQKKAKKIAERWVPYRTLASWVLWRSLEV